MVSLQSLDTDLFNWVNQGWSNPYLDWLMPFVSGNSYFVPAIAIIALALLWKGGARGRIYLLLMVVILLVGDLGVSASLKEWFGRLRPFRTIPTARLIVGMGDSGSMPSGHANLWFMATTITFFYYRKSIWVMLPLACLISVSRLYNGVHYPSDILAGAVLGICNGALGIWLANAIWTTWGRKLFPAWWVRLPSITKPVYQAQPDTKDGDAVEHTPTIDQQWLYLGYVAIGVFLLGRLVYLFLGRIDLSEDEAYQWVWSKHLALSYYSKPPLIAVTQFLGTSIWGDRMVGVRFFSPIFSAIVSVVMLRFLAREVSVMAGLWFVLISAATPMPAAGSILMTIDPLSVMFWTLAMVHGWKAIREGSTKYWGLTGLWMGLGFLSKYTAIFQIACWILALCIIPNARQQFRRPGPYLAVSVMALCAIPVVIWNWQHGWPTVAHLADRAGLTQTWKFTWNFFIDFVLAEFGLLHPVFFVAMIWAMIAFWRSSANQPVSRLLFAMGAPVFVGYLLYTFRARVQPNWIAPAVVPLFALMIMYWIDRWRCGTAWVKPGALVSFAVGFFAVVAMHETRLIQKLSGKSLPADLDPLVRVRAWSGVAEKVAESRRTLSREGKPVFVIGSHYGITGLLSFYIPEARAAIKDQPIVYYRSSDKPENQFYFWPGYSNRKHQNAIYAEVVKKGHPLEPPPERIMKEFGSMTDLGTLDIEYKGTVVHTIRLVAFRDLK